MKRFLFVFAIIWSSTLYSQTQILNSKVVAATVYNSGAQVTSEKKISLNKGTHTLVFEDLSPNIDESSIIITGLDDISLNSIAFETDFLKEMESSETLDKLENQLQTLEKQRVYTQNKITSLEKSIVLLEKNQELRNKESELTVAKVKAFKDYFSQQIESINNSIYDQNLEVQDLNQKIRKLKNEIQKIESDNRTNRGKVTLKLDVLKPKSTTLALRYFIYDAGWYASYDLKSNSIDENVRLSFKAEVYQTSGQDWENIELKLSTADPLSNKVKPELEPYYLDFNRTISSLSRRSIRNFTYNPSVKTVRGKVLDPEGMPLAGVNVVIGRKGALTDLNGNYSIDVNDGREIEFSFIGFQNKSFPIYSNTINVSLEPSPSLDEVVVVSYGNAKNAVNDIQEQKAPKIIEQQTSVEFVIPQKVTLDSNLDYTQIQLDKHQIDTKYEYYAAPELSNSVFLIAELENWQDLELISGEANLYFENSFLGTTFLNTTQLKDNLVISLGTDDKILMERTLPNKKTSQSFFGSNTIVEKAYEIELKNTKKLPISILMQERLPISQNEAIKVEDINYSDANYDEKKGFLNWRLQLNAGESSILNYSYTVKYPKNRSLNLRP